MRIMLFIITAFLMTGLYAEDKIQDKLEKRLQELDKKYLKAKRKYLDDARDDYKKLEIVATKKGNLDGALEYRKKVEVFEDRIAQLDFALKKGEPVKAAELGKSADIRSIEKTLGYKLSFVTRMREHKDAVKYEATGHYYKFFPTGRTITWDEAQKKCKEMGGHLATVTSDEELKAVVQATKLKWGTAAFIGMKDEKQSGDWKWVTGEPADFLPWWGTEPSRTPGEIHGCIYKNQFGDVPSGWSGLIGFICEWPK